jgi:tRNA (guanine-N7-)-methyltransferase
MIRGTRRCKVFVADEASQVCLHHTPQALEEARRITAQPKGAGGALLLDRISASQKRMYNPLGTPLEDEGVLGMGEGFGLADLSKPVLLDVGSARGKFVASLGKADASRNYIGAEVRKPLYLEAMGRPGREPNVSFLCANFLSERHQRQMAEAVAHSRLAIDRITVLFPDPWVRRKHRDRRVLQPSVVAFLAEITAPEATIFVASDVPDILTEAQAVMEASGLWFPLPDPVGNPFAPIASEREAVCEKEWRKVFRKLWGKRAKAEI